MIARSLRSASVALIIFGVLVNPAAADPQAGEKIFRECEACHSLEPGVNKVGPSLYGVVGRRPGSIDTYDYSKWMVRFGEGRVWDESLLIRYLASPQRVVIGTKMPFPGLPNHEDRVDLVDYLKSVAK